MHIARHKDIDLKQQVTPIFTGTVHTHMLIDESKGERLRLNYVSFSPGGRTTWHRHDFEQGLLIVEGRGVVATEEAEHIVEAGDVVVVPQGERHWHGATETTAMAHISITGPGETTVLEPVAEIKTKEASAE